MPAREGASLRYKYTLSCAILANAAALWRGVEDCRQGFGAAALPGHVLA